MPQEVKYIDIRRVIKESDSVILKKLPDFVISAIIMIVRQNEMNRILNKYSNDIGKDFLPKIIEEFNLNLEIDGLENLPENGRCFFVSNHPFGIIDGLVLTRIITQKYGNVKSIANEAFLKIPQLTPFIAAVNVFGQSSKEYVAALDEIYKADFPISHFPSGEVSRVYDGKIQDNVWQKSFITKAISSKRDIVPFHFHGRNSNLFYTIFLIRKVFGIKADIELILLPHEMFKKRNKTIKVQIGKPIPWHTFDKTHSHAEWARKVQSESYDFN